jgi:hypothetical protein
MHRGQQKIPSKKIQIISCWMIDAFVVFRSLSHATRSCARRLFSRHVHDDQRSKCAVVKQPLVAVAEERDNKAQKSNVPNLHFPPLFFRVWGMPTTSAKTLQTPKLTSTSFIVP